MLGFLLSATGDYAPALEALEDAYSLVEATPKYNQDEKNYMRAYISAETNQLVKRVLNDGDEAPDVGIPLHQSYDEIDLEKVRDTLRTVFRLPEHPKWTT